MDNNNNIAEYIIKNREKAIKDAQEWQAAAEKYHIPSSIKTRGEWLAYRAANNLKVDPDIWTGHNILEEIGKTQPVEEANPQETSKSSSSGFSISSLAVNLLLLPLAARIKPEILEEDNKYQDIEEKLKEKWLKEHPGKEITDQEGIDYVYGSLDNPKATTLHDEAKRIFREQHPEEAKKFDELAKKTYKKSEDDPAIFQTRIRIGEELQQRYLLMKKEPTKEEWEALEKKVQEKEWDKFAARYKDKAYVYNATNKDVKDALARQKIEDQVESWNKRWEENPQRLAYIKRNAPFAGSVGATHKLGESYLKPAQQTTIHTTYQPSMTRPAQIAPKAMPTSGNRKKPAAPNQPAKQDDVDTIKQDIKKATSWYKSPIAIVLIVLFCIATVAYFFGPSGAPPSTGGTGKSGKNATMPTGTTTQPIPGLTLALSGPDSVENGQDVTYSVQVSYDPSVSTVPIDQITAFETVPQNADFETAGGVYTYDPVSKKISWRLSETDNQQGFTFTLKPSQPDILIQNNVYATATNTPSTTTTPAAQAPPQTGGVCSGGGGFCSVDNLLPYFGNSQSAAQKASIICQRESGGVAGVINDGCLTGDSEDYSIGLFQINMLAWCPGAFSSFTTHPPYSCTIANQAILDACVAKYSDPVENIKKMVEMSANGTNWKPWYTPSDTCGIN